MALLFGDSMDAYGSGLSDLTEKWTNSGGGSGINTTGGRFGGGAYVFTDDANTALKSRNFSTFAGTPTNPRGGTSNAFRCAFHYKNDGGTHGEDEIFFLYGSGTNQADISLNSSGQIVLRQYDASNSTSLISGATGLVNVADGSWHHLEFELVFDNSAGVVKVWVDGVADISLTSIDTLSDGVLGTNGIEAIELYGYANSDNTYFDDVVCWDSEGSGLTSQLGQHRFDLLKPNADGTTNNFTRSSGSNNYELVDETPASDADYVESSTSTNKDLYDYEDLSVTPSSISGVLVNTRALNTDIGSISMNVVARSNTTEQDSAAKSLTSAALLYQEFFHQDPDTSSAWTKSGIDAAEFGVKVV